MPRNAPGLTGPFSYAEGRAAGLTPDELRSDSWSKPFHGVRSFTSATTVLELADAYLPRMRPDQYFSHTTAAIIHRTWLPLALEERMEVHVAVPPGSRQPRGKHVRGHLLVDRPGSPTIVDGLRVARAEEAWCQLATILGLEDLIVAGEGLLAKGRFQPLRVWDLQAAVAAGDRPRQALLDRALPELREGVRSPRETALRRWIVAEGLPEPRINIDAFDRFGAWLAELDLAYPELLLGIEYDGRPHFATEAQQRKDVYKHELLQAAGWRVIRVTKDDLRLRRARPWSGSRTPTSRGAPLAARTHSAPAALPRIGNDTPIRTPICGKSAHSRRSRRSALPRIGNDTPTRTPI